MSSLPASHFKSNGKLLLSGEYLALKGCRALALPSVYYQDLTVQVQERIPWIKWTSMEHGQTWFEAEFDRDFRVVNATDSQVASALSQILISAYSLNPEAWEDHGYELITNMNFDRHWGLGSSSTLVNNLAEWLKVDPFQLQAETFGGSGYDIACARADQPIVYRMNNGLPEWRTADFAPPFSDQLFFVYQNVKMNSRAGIRHFESRQGELDQSIEEVNQITDELITCQDLDIFEGLLDRHERILSEILGIDPVKQQQFPDFQGTVKSLGAWGGDFILATGNEDARKYFINKGYPTVIGFDEMVKMPNYTT